MKRLRTLTSSVFDDDDGSMNMLSMQAMMTELVMMSTMLVVKMVEEVIRSV